jgi:hypothetical protein
MEKSKTRWSLLQSPQGRLWLLLGLSLLALLGEQWAPGFSRPVLYSLLGVGLLTVGLGHGAMDQITTARARQLPLGAFIGLYLGVMALMALFWWLWAYGALVVFLLYSALHFGETDLRSMGPHHWGWHLLWGSLLLLMILSGQREKRLAGLTALLVLGYGLPLLMAFGLYFIGQHSVQGWLDLHRSLQRSHRALLREAAPYTLGAWLGLAGALYWSGGALAQYTAALFVFISCVSLPHVVLMAAFYRER